MEPLVAGLVLLSAALHPVRDSVLRSDPQPSTAYLAMVASAMVVSGAHVTLARKDLLSILEVWPLLSVSLTGMLLYSFFLVLTFSRGDLSVYYPITRSSPLFIVIVGVLLLAKSYSWEVLAGIILIVAGGFLLQRRPGIRAVYDPATLCFALLAMAGHGMSAMADGYAVRVIDPTIWFFWNWGLLSPIVLLLFRRIAAVKVQWPPFAHWRRAPLRYVAGGATLYASYYMILVALSLGGDVAAVTAVRQASIPLAVLIGGTLLAEEAMFRRLLLSLVMATGIVIIILSP